MPPLTPPAEWNTDSTVTAPTYPNGDANSRHPEPAKDQVKQACTVLYDSLPTLDAARLQADLQALVGPCEVEWAAPSNSDLPLTAGLVRWGQHRVAMLALDAPAKQEVLARTVAVSPMPEDLRQAMIAHKATIRLLYVGDAPAPLAQLTAIYSVTMALLMRGGLGVLNERAALGQPAELVLSYLPQLGGNPPPLELWIGAVTFSRENEGLSRQYLMRTYGMEQFALSELAVYMADRSAADDCYHLLLNIALYMIEGGPSLKMDAGHTAEFKKRTYLFTEPTSKDPEFASPTGLFVLVEV